MKIHFCTAKSIIHEHELQLFFSKLWSTHRDSRPKNNIHYLYFTASMQKKMPKRMTREDMRKKIALCFQNVKTKALNVWRRRKTFFSALFSFSSSTKRKTTKIVHFPSGIVLEYTHSLELEWNTFDTRSRFNKVISLFMHEHHISVSIHLLISDSDFVIDSERF